MTQRSNSKFIVLGEDEDLKLRVIAKTLEDLFIQALQGLAHLLYHNYQGNSIATIKIPIKVSSINVNSLLVDFLSETLYQSEMTRSVFFEVKMRRFTNSKIEAELFGRKINQFERNIKVISYHGVSVLRNSEGFWQAEIVFGL